MEVAQAEGPPVGTIDGDREGQHREKSCGPLCERPGCYVRVLASARSPLKKFCCASCAQALRVVLEREARWRRRLCRAA
jgi:hypothetical protein